MFAGWGSRGRQPPLAGRSGAELLEDRLALSTLMPAVSAYQTQQPVTPGASGAYFQFVKAGTFQAVSRLTLTVSDDATGVFDLGFHAVAQSNSPLDLVSARYLDRRPARPQRRPPDEDRPGRRPVADLVGNGLGNYASLTLVRQITLTPGNHTSPSSSRTRRPPPARTART